MKVDDQVEQSDLINRHAVELQCKLILYYGYSILERNLINAPDSEKSVLLELAVFWTLTEFERQTCKK